MKKALIVFGLIVVAFFVIAAAGSKSAGSRHIDGDRATVSMAQFSSLKTGMTLDEAVAILGGPGQELSSNDIAGIQTVMYMWKGAGVGNMNAMFQNGRLVQKSQFGLK